MAFLELNDVQKYFGHIPAVASFNLNVNSGEFVAFLGQAAAEKQQPCARLPALSAQLRVILPSMALMSLISLTTAATSAWYSNPTRYFLI